MLFFTYVFFCVRFCHYVLNQCGVSAQVFWKHSVSMCTRAHMQALLSLIVLCACWAQALIHVSTAYCNCDREEVNEVIYPPPYDPEKIIQCMEWMDDDLIQALTPK